MMQRTHDLAGIALVSYRFLAYPTQLNWETILGIGIATILGTAVPDIDNVSSPAWQHKLMPWEGKAARDFLEGHRNLSHSLIGLGLFYVVFRLLIKIVPLANLDSNLISQAFFGGMLSHLLTDSLTEQGVPWLYPIPWKMGFPPIKRMRIKTGKWFEKIVIVPLLLILIVWVFYTFRENIGTILKS